MKATNNDRHVLEETYESSDDKVLFSYFGPKFSEVDDPIAAMMWISCMEDFFEYMKSVNEYNKVMYAVSVLRSEALVWWETLKVTRGGPNMTWSQFKEVFKDEFYPISVELELVERYKTLKQGRNERVVEYTTRFEKLSWFFWHHLTYEKRFIYLFVSRLRDDIKRFILTSDMTTFEKTVEAAKGIERKINDINKS